MGLGDNILATGMAKGAAGRGKRIAFGDGKKIIWDQNSPIIFSNNPNIASPGTERLAHLLEWIPFYRGNRLYNKQGEGRWIWNYDFRPIPGELFLTNQEQRFRERCGRRGFVVIEPNVPLFKSVAPNKQWPVDRYAVVANALRAAGYDVVQFNYGRGHKLAGARQMTTPTFRHAFSALSIASLFIGPEGGLHHAAAAAGIPAVVLFGGFIPPVVTGYPTHTNLTGGVTESCGSHKPCLHCLAAMRAIGVDEVLTAAERYLTKAAA